VLFCNDVGVVVAGSNVDVVDDDYDDVVSCCDVMSVCVAGTDAVGVVDVNVIVTDCVDIVGIVLFLLLHIVVPMLLLVVSL